MFSSTPQGSPCPVRARSTPTSILCIGGRYSTLTSVTRLASKSSAPTLDCLNRTTAQRLDTDGRKDPLTGKALAQQEQPVPLATTGENVGRSGSRTTWGARPSITFSRNSRPPCPRRVSARCGWRGFSSFPSASSLDRTLTPPFIS